MTGDIVALASSFGGPGLLIAFMIWDRSVQNKLTQSRIEADLKVATALTLLAERVG